MHAGPPALQGPRLTSIACNMDLGSCLLLQVIAKGKPEDALPGIKDKQQQFAEGQNSISGVLNSQGTKVGNPSSVRGGNNQDCRLTGAERLPQQKKAAPDGGMRSSRVVEAHTGFHRSCLLRVITIHACKSAGHKACNCAWCCRCASLSRTTCSRYGSAQLPPPRKVCFLVWYG